MTAVLVCVPLAARAQMLDDGEPTDEGLLDLDFEELLDTEIVTPTKTRGELWESPSSVTIITAEEIRLFGFRTVWEALQTVVGSVPGSDGGILQVSLRGKLEPATFNNRILWLVDGHRISDSYFQDVTPDQRIGVAIENIDRIEVISGPGSVLYGSGAFDGIVNVVTRSSLPRDGLEGSVHIGGHIAAPADYPVDGLDPTDRRGGTFSFGVTHDDGSRTLASGSIEDYSGRRMYIPYFEATGQGGVVSRVDRASATMFLLKHRRNDLTVELDYVRYQQSRPLAPYAAMPGSLESGALEEMAFADVRYDRDLSDQLSVNARAYADWQNFHGTWAYEGYDQLDTQKVPDTWFGTDTYLTWRLASNELVAGVQAEHHRTEQTEDYPSENGYYAFDRYRYSNVAAYLYDQYKIGDQLILHAGGRLKYNNEFGTVLVTRGSVAYRPMSQLLVRLHAGEAFRNPLLHDYHYRSSVLMMPQTEIEELDFERTRTLELSVATQGKHHSVELMAYRDHDTTVVSFDSDQDHYYNDGGGKTYGLELKASYRWAPRLIAYVNGALVDHPADGDGETLNAPPFSLKYGVSYTALMRPQLSIALWGQLYGKQDYADFTDRPGVDLRQPAYNVLNLHVLSSRNAWDTELSFLVSNVLNQSYAYPVFKGTQQPFPAPGRSYQLTLRRPF